jgi:L-ascorbate metabolism protein UlaG (beta-lactamase superfamily)
MLPIGAYKPAFLMKASHTNPQESVSLFNQLGAKTFIPMHYATYDLSDEPISEPIRTVQNLHKTGVLQGELQDLAVGERFMFGQKNYQPLKQTNHH